MSVKKPEDHKLYRKELPKVNTTGYSSNEKKLSTFQIIIKGILREEMEPKQYLKYDSIKTEFRIYLFTGIITYSLFYIAFHSSYMSAPATESNDDTWGQRVITNVINFIVDQWNRLVHTIKSL